MKTGIAQMVLLAGLAMSAGHVQTSAQQLSLQRVAFLPLISDESISVIAESFQNRLKRVLRLPPGKVLLEQSSLDDLLVDRSAEGILSRTTEMETFASTAGASYLIGGVLTRLDDGSYQFNLLIFDESGRQIVFVHTCSFANDAALLRGAEEVAAELLRGKNYTSADSAFFYSILVPGMGQWQLKKPVHALVSAGMVGLSIMYAASAPKADSYLFSRGGFEADWAAETFDHSIRDVDVTAAEFYQQLDENWEHYLRAQAERRAVKVRRKRATGLVVVAYLFNVVDSLVLARERPDSSPFFLSLEGVAGQSDISQAAGLSVQLRISFR